MPDRERLTILADDLTGALDSAAVFASRGRSTAVVLGQWPGDLDDYDVVSVNMDTRRAMPDEAIQTVSETLRVRRDARRDVNMPIRFVKIDSTLRGHPGIEVGVYASLSRAAVALMTPSFPAQGRTVTGGELHVHGVPLAETEVGNDPLSPLKSSRVAEVISDFSAFETHEIQLEQVRDGRLTDRLVDLPDAGDRPAIVLLDAETDEDLDLIVEAGLQFESATTPVAARKRSGVFFAGSAGLASALARKTSAAETDQAAAPPTFKAPVLLVTASQRSLAADQIHALDSEFDVETHTVAVNVYSNGTSTPASLNSNAIGKLLTSHRNVALQVTASGDLESMSPQALRRAADSITEQLGQLVASLVRQHQIGGLIIIGGDTAREVLLSVDARGIVLAAEPLPGVPVGTILGGTLGGVPIATKAGAFGDEQTLVTLFNQLDLGGNSQ